KSYATTERYAHHYTESLRRGINVLNVQTEHLNSDGRTERDEGSPEAFITNLSQSGKNTLDFSPADSREVFDIVVNAREGT
ncbi:MAG TPA: hypothetical protein VHO68_10695, partial [Bacteroidales bacterium]|nr:hypothetical protein [Bacteroidales bacterium]